MYTTQKEADLKVDLKNDANNLTNDAKDAVHRLKTAAGAVKGDMEDIARRAGGHAREFADSVGKSAEEISETLVEKIRKKPVQSTLIAAGAGVIIGMLFRR